MENFELDYFVPTGEMLKEYLEIYDMTQKELAQRIGISEKHMTQILKSDVSLNMEIAIGFEKVFGVKAITLMNYENGYREYISKKKKFEDLEKKINCKEIHDKFDINYLVRAGFIDKNLSPIKKVDALFSFLGVSSLDAFYTVYSDKILGFSYKHDGYTIEPLAVWLRVGEKLLQNEPEISEYNENRVNDLIKELRVITVFEPVDVISKAKSICNKYGVYLVVATATRNSKVRGATSYLGRNPIIQLSTRFKTHDIFVHSLYHELVHLKKHIKKGRRLLELEDVRFNDLTQEKEADETAAEYILSREKYYNFINTIWNETQEGILNFAKKINIHPGIILGRMQHDGIVDFKLFNKLKLTLD